VGVVRKGNLMGNEEREYSPVADVQEQIAAGEIEEIKPRKFDNH
jgi:hypothetical protein